MNKIVAIIMGSTSDLPVMQDAIDVLKELDIEIQVDVVSAHRTPEKMFEFGKTAHENGIAVIIAGAGGAATKAKQPVEGRPMRSVVIRRSPPRRSPGAAEIQKRR